MITCYEVERFFDDITVKADELEREINLARTRLTEEELQQLREKIAECAEGENNPYFDFVAAALKKNYV